MFDFNDAGPQSGPMGELIPDGSFVKLRMTIRPGGADGAVQMDAGLLKASGKSDAKMIDCEFVVMEGPFAKRRFWEMFVVDGGKRDDKGNSIGWNMTKATIRAMIESALKLDPNDMSDAAKAKRSIQGLKQLDGITFAARVMVEPSSDPQYKDQNKLANVVLPSEPQYTAIMTGQPVEPDPVNAKPRNTKPAATSQPAGWQQNQQAGGWGQQAAQHTPPPAQGGSAPADLPDWARG